MAERSSSPERVRARWAFSGTPAMSWRRVSHTLTRPQRGHSQRRMINQIMQWQPEFWRSGEVYLCSYSKDINLSHSTLEATIRERPFHYLAGGGGGGRLFEKIICCCIWMKKIIWPSLYIENFEGALICCKKKKINNNPSDRQRAETAAYQAWLFKKKTDLQFFVKKNLASDGV